MQNLEQRLDELEKAVDLLKQRNMRVEAEKA